MKAFDIGTVPRDEITRFVSGLHSDPFRLLGPHRVGDDLEIRTFRPDAHGIDIVLDREPEKTISAERVHEEGFFCAAISNAARDVAYHVRITNVDGSEARGGDS